MTDERIGRAQVLAAAEAAAPVDSLDAVARLRDRFGARYVSFLFVDVVGRRLLRVHDTASQQQEDRAARIPPAGGGVYDDVLRYQRLILAPDGGQGQRVLAPVTYRGDTIGVLDLFLTDTTKEVLVQVQEAAPAKHPSSPSPAPWSPPPTSPATPTTSASTSTHSICRSPTRWATTSAPP